MKNLLISLSLLLVLISFGTLVFMDTAGAQNNLVGDLLNLPAPPPPNPLFGGPGRARDEKFYDKKNPPGDDAPIEDLIEYWQTQSTNYSDLAYNLEPSRETLEPADQSHRGQTRTARVADQYIPRKRGNRRFCKENIRRRRHRGRGRRAKRNYRDLAQISQQVLRGRIAGGIAPGRRCGRICDQPGRAAGPLEGRFFAGTADT